MTDEVFMASTRPGVKEIILGEGRVAVAHSVDYRGMPALTFTPTKTQGTPGDPYVSDVPMIVGEGSVVLAFSTIEAVLAHLDRLNALMQAIQQKLKEKSNA